MVVDRSYFFVPILQRNRDWHSMRRRLRWYKLNLKHPSNLAWKRQEFQQNVLFMESLCFYRLFVIKRKMFQRQRRRKLHDAAGAGLAEGHLWASIDETDRESSFS